MSIDDSKIVNFKAISIHNSSERALKAGQDFTGQAEKDDYFTAVGVSVSTDKDGTLFVEFSSDSENWDTSLSFSYVVGRINPPHIFQHLGRHVRIRFVNTSGEDQTYFRLHTSFGEFNQLTAPINGLLAETFDAISVRPTDYMSEVAMGKRQGRGVINKFGWNHGISNGPEIVASQRGQIAVMLTPDTLNLVSSDANDATGGTGASLILVSGIDANFNEIEEYVPLNGTTPVTTTNQYLGVNRMVVITSGSQKKNVGNIDATDTAGTVGIQARIPAESSVTQQLIYHTPINHTLLVKWILMTALKTSGGGPPKIGVKGYSHSRVTDTRYEVFDFEFDTDVSNLHPISMPIPFPIGGREVLYFEVTTDQPNTNFNMRLSGTQERIS